MKIHYWQGQWLDDAGLERILAEPGSLAQKLGLDRRRSFSVDAVLIACERMAQTLREPNSELSQSLIRILRHGVDNFDQDQSDRAAGAILEELATFLQRSELETKLRRELGMGSATVFPFRLERIDPRVEIFESWTALGLLVHISPTNSLNLPFLALIEGLLCGNLNIVKVGSADHADALFTQRCAEALIQHDPSGLLKDLVAVVAISSRRKDLLGAILKEADGVSVWGGEEAIEAVRSLAPPSARFIAWGHKISFAYFEKSRLSENTAIRALAREICNLEQQACSSPQIVYLETDSDETLFSFATSLGDCLKELSPTIPRLEPGQAERAEISHTVLMAETEQALRNTRHPAVLQDTGGHWRIFIDEMNLLQASPLFRSIRVKKLRRSQIVELLRPFRRYLQTVGLECPPSELSELTDLFFQAGALRITRVGQMVSGYIGEPHDEVYALQRFTRRVSVAYPELPQGISALNERSIESPERAWEVEALKGLPIIGKKEVAQRNALIPTEEAQVYFKSGGSSGEPVLSVFSYDDYDVQMKLASQGLLAAGLDPARDRSANLFFAGGLYGGFLSFFSILSQLRAVQIPIAALPDLKLVGQWIVRCKVNTLLGMPSYIWNLLVENEALFNEYRKQGGGIQKIFYGGEHFTLSQRRRIQERFGISVIRSATYGSNDIGPIGFQCVSCEGSVHHLHERLQILEILRLDKDAPAEPGEVGRLIFSSRIRHGQQLLRYEIGDLGRLVPGPCPCGRQTSRFELLGRYGDVFRAGGVFLSYEKFAAILGDQVGEFQLVISRDVLDRLDLRASPSTSSADAINTETLRSACLAAYPDLREVVEHDRTLHFQVTGVESKDLERTAGSGKLRHVIDSRPINQNH